MSYSSASNDVHAIRRRFGLLSNRKASQKRDSIPRRLGTRWEENGTARKPAAEQTFGTSRGSADLAQDPPAREPGGAPCRLGARHRAAGDAARALTAQASPPSAQTETGDGPPADGPSPHVRRLVAASTRRGRDRRSSPGGCPERRNERRCSRLPRRSASWSTRCDR